MLQSTFNRFGRFSLACVKPSIRNFTATNFNPINSRNGVDVYIGNLEESLTAESLKMEIAKRYQGEFGGPRIIFNRAERKSLGFGYITLPTKDDAMSAIDSLQGMVVNDREVKVDLGQERRIFRAAFFGNLDPEVTEDDLTSLLEETIGEGVVSKIRLAKHEDGSSKGFAHVDFKEGAQRDRALSELNGHELKGRPMKVDKAVLKTRLPVVYIGNISYDVNQQHIEMMLDEIVGAGNYTDVRLHYDKVTGYPRGFAHVTFLTKRIANKAVEELGGIEMMGRPLRANFSADKPNRRQNE